MATQESRLGALISALGADIKTLFDRTDPVGKPTFLVHPDYEGIQIMIGPASERPDSTEVENVLYFVLPDRDGGVPL